MVGIDFIWASDDFDWDYWYGDNGQLLVDSAAAYNFEEQHQALKVIMGGDFHAAGASTAIPL